jgi:hypothetical protein
VVFKSIELVVHAPDINFVCRDRDGESLTDLYVLNGVIFGKAIFNNSKIIQRPTVIRIAYVKIDEGLKIDNTIHY